MPAPFDGPDRIPLRPEEGNARANSHLTNRATGGFTAALKRRLRGGLWKYYLGFGLGRLATIVILPIVSRSLGPEDLGYFEPALAVLLAAMIVGDVGMGTAVVRFYGDPRYPLASLLRTAGVVQLIASFGAFAALATPLVIIAPPGSSPATVLIALALFTLIEGFAVLGAGLLRATDQNGLYLALSALRVGVAATVGAIGLIVAGAGGALFGVAFAGLGFAAVAARAVVQGPSGWGARSGRARLLRYGLPLMATSLMTWTLSLSDRVFLSAWTTPLELARYSASYRLGGVVGLFMAAPLALAWLPVARKANTLEEQTRLGLKWASRFAACSLGAGAALVAASGALVPLVFGYQLHADRAIVAAAGVSGWLFGLYFLIATRILLGESTKQLGVIMVTVVLFNLASNAVLIHEWGAKGAALATALSYLALCVTTGISAWRLQAAHWLFHPIHTVTVAALLGLVGLAVLSPGLALLAVGVGAVLMAVRRMRAASW